ncbi:MAG: response regulator [Negativicutes bacterium]|jgi:two-component system chemotaxis sensor kinase CheA
MRMKSKLSSGFGLIVTVMGLAIGLVAIMLTRQIDAVGDTVDKRYHNVDLANIISNQTSRIAIASRDIILENDTLATEEGFDAINLARTEKNEAMLALEAIEHGSDTEHYIQDIKRFQQEYLQVESRVRSLIRQGDYEEAAILLREGERIRDQLRIEVDQLVLAEKQGLEDALYELDETYRFSMKLLLLALSVIIATGLVLTFLMTKSITNSVESMTKVIANANFGTGGKLPRVEHITNDEIGDIARSYNKLADALEEQVRHEKEMRTVLENQTWIKAELAEIAMHNQGVSSYEELGTQVITRLAKAANAHYGALYLIARGSKISKLVRLAAYAGQNQGESRQEMMLGEGIAGQCALEQQAILLTDIPENYIKISSGLGEAPPRNLIAIPVILSGQTLAVIELASFTPFTQLQREFLEQAADNIAVALSRIEAKQHIDMLLQEAQALNEELRAQSEELQMRQEELHSINEQLELQCRTSEEKAKELEIVKTQLEEKAQQVEISSKYKSEFLANMSHELRTPLNSMLILAQILADNSTGNLNDKQVEYAKTIFSSGSDLLDLINDILDISKIESGKIILTKAEVAVCSFIEDLRKKFMPIAQHKNLFFNLQIEEDFPPAIYTDEIRLEQIIVNLLSNAFKFTEQGGVFLKLSTQTKPSGEVVLKFSVTDTGIGIAPHQQKVIFEEFKQADSTNTRKYGGTGLGLAISRKLAELLEGHIELESSVGQGSKFTLYLPQGKVDIEQAADTIRLLAETAAAVDLKAAVPAADSGAIERAEQPFEEPAKLTNRKILLVDDDIRNIYALTTALEDLNMEVIFAENGREAIERLTADDCIDLVLMDIMMPEMDGYEAIRTIRSNSKYQHLPIIALTANAMKTDREKCLEAGASDYISKPVNLEQLYSLIKLWLANGG